MASKDRKEAQNVSAQSDYVSAVPRFANAVQCRFAHDHFMLDFLFRPDPSALLLLARVVLSPQHTKRLCAVLAAQIKAYEATFGAISAAEPVIAPEAAKSTGRPARKQKKKAARRAR